MKLASTTHTITPLTEQQFASLIDRVRVNRRRYVAQSPLRMATHLSLSWTLMRAEYLATMSAEVVLAAQLRALADAMRADAESEMEDTQPIPVAV